MKLEEQLFQVHFTEDSIPRIVNAKLTKKGVISLENFAIGFSEWLMIKCDYKPHCAWEYQGNEYTQKELLEIYKKTL